MSERSAGMRVPSPMIRPLLLAALLLPLPLGEGRGEVRSTIVPAPRAAAAPEQELPLPPGEGRGGGGASCHRRTSPHHSTANHVDLRRSLHAQTNSPPP